MKKIIFLSGLAGLFTVLLLTFNEGGGGAQAAPDNVLVVGLSADYPPFEFQQAGELVGFDVEVAQLVAEQLGMKVEFKNIDFSTLVPAVQSGLIDCAISAMAPSPERRKNIDFSDVYFMDTFAVVSKKSSPLASGNAFVGKKIGVQLGTTMEHFVRKLVSTTKGLELFVLNTHPMLIEALKNGCIDGVVMGLTQAQAFVANNSELVFASLQASDEGYAVALAQGSPLKKQINGALKKLRESGALDALKKQWFSGKEV